MDTISEMYNFFNENYQQNIKNVNDSNAIYNNANGLSIQYTQAMHESIVEKSFINIFLLWEKFLEHSFILYMCGKADLQGNIYSTYVSPNDEEHAYAFLKGAKKYPDWTNLDEVNILAALFFEQSGPYTLLKNKPREFLDVKIIRNKISHMSNQSNKQFTRLIVRETNQGLNMTVSQFLEKQKSNAGCTYFSYYTDFIKSFVEAICNK